MAKDPAFLMYTKDWLEGTAELLPEEKGVYIDLLCYQHQKGDLPTDLNRLARLVRVSIEEFNKIWVQIKDKFEQTDNRMVNRKLYEVMNERSIKGKRNTISGTFAAVLRNAKLDKKQYSFVKSQFNIDNFEQIERERLTECLTEWLKERLKSIEDANEDANEDININKSIIDYLNKKLNSDYKYSSLKTISLIEARIKQGFNETDFKKVIDIKTKEWINTDMQKYLRPETLFGTKFESYLNSIFVEAKSKPIVISNDALFALPLNLQQKVRSGEISESDAMKMIMK